MARTPGAKDKQPRQIRADSKSPKGIIAGQDPGLEAGYNTRRIAFMMAILPAEPLDKSDPIRMVEEMERRFQSYLQKCAEWDMKIGNQAAYAAIGITKDDVYNWLNRVNANPAVCDFVKKVQKVCAMYREGLMEDGKVNPVTGIFWQKNYDGMKDQQEVVLTPNANPLGEGKDAEALQQKYLENTYGITELPESAESPLALPEVAEGQKAKLPKTRRKTQKDPQG